MKIKTKDDAEKAGLSHLDIEREIAEIEAERDRRIAEAREDAKLKLTALRASDKTIMENLADWFWSHEERDEKTKGQLTLTHVKLTQRDTQKYVYPSPLTKVIDKAKKMDLKQFVRVKEEVDKARIKAEASEDQLKVLGVKVKVESTVYVEQV